MNIFDARKLQKKLYKESICDFKIMRTKIQDDTLCYTVSHRINESNSMILNNGNVKRVMLALDNDVVVGIGYAPKDNLAGIPEGFYISEIIEIDD